MSYDYSHLRGSIVFRPMVAWPHDATPAHRRRGRYAFRAAWGDTLGLLLNELRLLKASDLVIGAGLHERDVRADGLPRADARVPVFPGVEVSFATDVLLGPEGRRGRLLIQQHGSLKNALRATHPDTGGDEQDFKAVQEASQQRRLVYATDVCELWQHNVRSIALGLKALRDVDRYGISKRGEQYAGFRAALTAGS